MNKMVKIGSLCLIVALGLVFVGCEDFQKVEFGSTAAPKIISLEKGTIYDYELKFEAASGASSYKVVLQQVGKKRIYEVSSVNWLVNTADYDIRTAQFNKPTLTTSGSFRVGVMVEPYRRDKNPSTSWASTPIDL